MQEADSEHCSACKSLQLAKKPQKNTWMLLELEGSYWISLSVIALFENVNRTTKISCSRDEKQQKDAQAADFFFFFCTKGTLSQALRDEQHMFT